MAQTGPRVAQIKLLGKLAAKLDADPRHPVDIINDFFLFTDREREIFMQAYRGGDDPITADIR